MRANSQENDSVREFVKDKKASIVYFFDADIAAMFASPKGKVRYFNIFRNWLDESSLLSTLTLTAEFLFSGNLPGQRTDHLSTPPFITPDHFDDVDNMIEEVSKKGATHAANLTEPDKKVILDRQVEIKALIKRYSDSKIISEVQFLESLQKILPQTIMDLIQGPLAEAQQWKRLLEQIVRADAMPWFHSELLEPDEDAITEWEDRLDNVIAHGRDKRNIIRDARSITQLLALNEEDPSRRYVLVTGDSAIRAAYREYSRKMREEGRLPRRLILRRPDEYAPLINLGAMNRFNARLLELFPQIEDALDDLLIGISTEHSNNQAKSSKIEDAPGYIGATAGRRDARDVSGGGNKDSDKQIDQLCEWWAEVAVIAIQLNVRYLRSRHEALFSSLESVLAQDDVVDAAIGQFHKLMAKLSHTHVRFTFDGIVARYRRTPPDFGQSDLGIRRAPLQITLERFKSLIGEIRINEYLDKLHKGEADIPYDKLLKETNYGLSNLFGACVALASEEWITAHSFAQRALEFIAKGPSIDEELLNEARYCLALTSRFALDIETATEFSQAQQLLKDSIAYYEKESNKSGLIRSKAELGSLIRVYLYKKSLVSGPIPGILPKGEQSLSSLWNGSLQILVEAEDILIDTPEATKKKMPRLFGRVANQIYANKAALWIYAYWVSPRMLSDMPTARIRQDLDELLERINVTHSPIEAQVFNIGRVFAMILEFILSDDPELKRILADRAHDFVGRILESKRDMVDYDRAELEYFRASLKTELSKISSQGVQSRISEGDTAPSNG